MIIIESGFTGIEQPLKHPRIGWHKEPGTLAFSSAAPGFASGNADTPNTDTAWKPISAPAIWGTLFPGPKSPSYLGIAAHRIADAGATVQVYKNIAGAWSAWGGGTFVSPGNNDPILFLLEPQDVDGIGIRVTNGTPEIGHIRAGNIMEWPQLATWTGTPITESVQIDYNVNESGNGNWLGRSATARGQEFTVEVDNLSEFFRRGDFKDFANHANLGDATFWIAPRPQGYLEEVAYAWSLNVVRMSREIPNKNVSGSVQLQLAGHLPI